METLLKKQCLKVIEKIHYVIYDFIKQQIDYIDDEEEMNNSKVVKIYAETCISQLNEAMTKELPEILNEEFNECIQTRIEDISYIWRQQIGYEFIKNNKSIKYEDDECERITSIVEINNTPKVAEVIEIKPKVEISFNSFMESIPNEPMEVNELTQMYNNYFGVNISARSFGMLRIVKDSFAKDSKIIKGKKVTMYQKK